MGWIKQVQNVVHVDKVEFGGFRDISFELREPAMFERGWAFKRIGRGDNEDVGGFGHFVLRLHIFKLGLGNA